MCRDAAPLRGEPFELLARRGSEHAMRGQTLEEIGVGYSPMQPKAALRAGEMQRRYRQRGGNPRGRVGDEGVGMGDIDPLPAEELRQPPDAGR